MEQRYSLRFQRMNPLPELNDIKQLILDSPSSLEPSGPKATSSTALFAATLARLHPSTPCLQVPLPQTGWS